MAEAGRRLNIPARKCEECGYLYHPTACRQQFCLRLFCLEMRGDKLRGWTVTVLEA